MYSMSSLSRDRPPFLAFESVRVQNLAIRYHTSIHNRAQDNNRNDRVSDDRTGLVRRTAALNTSAITIVIAIREAAAVSTLVVSHPIASNGMESQFVLLTHLGRLLEGKPVLVLFQKVY